MLYYQETRPVGLIVFSIALFAFASFLALPLYAQQSTPSAAAERARQRQTRRNDQMETEIRISSLERESRQPPEEKSERLAYAQLKDDFEQLQTVNNRMMVMVFANNVIDYKSISEAITEIRKRAARLKSNLPLPIAEKDAPEDQSLKDWTEINQAQVKPVLKALDALIQRFVTNPVFQQPQVVDVQQSSKAKRDLEAIIKLSEKIRKSADKLAKASMP
ncbi:MAG TPA: hypothetical protein VF779_19755 [Pyrinomonadaceae bacterium]